MAKPAKRKTLTPAAYVAQLFGSRNLGRLLELSESTVCQWERRGGLIPQKHHAPLLGLAKREGKRLTAENLIFGGEVVK